MSETVFKERYKYLNKKQKEAVDSIEGPVMVIAGPGTGKTTILTLRIANILKKTDTPPSGILALTFTDAGVKVMKSKLREIIGSESDEVRVHTFHSFAGSIIAEFAEHFPHLRRSKQITEVEAESLLREILKNKKYSKLRPLGDTDFYLGKILSSISDCKKEAWTPEEVLKFAKQEIERIKKDQDSVSTRGASRGSLKAEALKRIEKCEKTFLFADVFLEYEEKKKAERKIDFDDLLFELLNTLKKDKLLLQMLQEKFLYILVDEHQDTNDTQNLIISLLANFFETPNLFVVGDEKQAIYRFQGASVENFLKFQNIWKNMKVIPLEENYRSHQSILDATFKMIEENYDEGEHQNLRVKLKSGSEHKRKPIDIVFTEDTDSADAYLVEELKNISKKEKDSTVAVILRWNRDIDHVLSLCELNGISVSAERGVDIFSHPLGMMYFKVLEYISDVSKTESLALTVGSGLWGLSFSEASLVVKKIRSGILKDLEKDLPNLSILQKEMNKVGVIDFLILAGELSGVASKEKLTNPLAVEVWRAIIDLARDIAKNKSIENSSDLIKELLDYRKTSEGKVVKIGSGRIESNIHIMTAHSSKGLEYDYVFLPYSLEEYWIRRPRASVFVLPKERDTSDELRDTRRLFYVALTRARKHVVVLVPAKNNLGKDFTPLRFTLELDKKDVSTIEIPKVKTLPKTLNGDTLKSHKKSEIIEYSKRILIENGLSVTALNHFLKCPSRFLYKSILKVPEAPTPSSEKGIAMHKAISEVWNNKDTSVLKITKTIKDSVENYFEESLLPKSEKEIVLEELVQNAPTVAKALEEHFKLKGFVSTDKWLDFVFKDKNQKVEVKLHGQMDSIVDTENKTFVFDYKTREALSLNAIKGETKDSDGDYFRQLIFYKMLLESSREYKDKVALPALVFVKPDSKGRCPTVAILVSKEDTQRVYLEIETLISSVFSGDFLNKKCEDKDCEYCTYKDFLLS